MLYLLCVYVAKSDDKAKINNVKITPDPPQKGKNVEVNASITFGMEITQITQHNPGPGLKGFS